MEITKENIECGKIFIDWEERRYEIAKAAMHAEIIGIVTDNNPRRSANMHEVARHAIKMADEREQEIVSELYRVLIIRTQINEKLKAQIKDICPILIKGSIEEARKTKEA